MVPVPVDLSKLSDIVKNDVVKKAVYDIIVEKVNNIGTSGIFLKTKYEVSVDTSELVKKTDYNAKITEIEGKIPSTGRLAPNVALMQ